MDVRGVGAGPTGAELSSALRALAGPAAQRLAALADLVQSGDSINGLLRQLSQSDVLKLLEIIDRPLPPENASLVQDLLRASVQAVAEGNVPQALAKLSELAVRDPPRAETFQAEPGLASIRADVEHLMFRLASTAQLDAESRLGQATDLLRSTGSKELPGQEIRPEIAILTAGRFLEAGGYVNCVRSAELSQMAINQYGIAPTPVPLVLLDSGKVPRPSARPGWRESWRPRIRNLWLRAPLLVLLLAWLTVGLVGGTISALLRNVWPQALPESLVAVAFDVWGIGFLTLIAFGFYVRVRNWRR